MVGDKLNAALVLPDRRQIIAAEAWGDANEPWRRPVDDVWGVWSKSVIDQHLVVGTVILKPVEVEQTLIDQVGGLLALVLDDDRRGLVVNAQRVDASTVALPRRVLSGKKLHPEEGREMVLEQLL